MTKKALGCRQIGGAIYRHLKANLYKQHGGGGSI